MCGLKMCIIILMQIYVIVDRNQREFHNEM